VDSQGLSEYLKKADVLGADGKINGREEPAAAEVPGQGQSEDKSPGAEAQVFANTPSSFGFEEHWQAFQAPHLRALRTNWRDPGETLRSEVPVQYAFAHFPAVCEANY